MALQMSWDEILKGVAVSYVNHGLTALAAILALKLKFSPEILSPENILILSSAIVLGAISLGMNLYRKKVNHNIIESARNAEPGTRFSAIEAEAAKLPIIGTGDGK